jgi:hypothetical protein
LPSHRVLDLFVLLLADFGSCSKECASAVIQSVLPRCVLVIPISLPPVSIPVQIWLVSHSFCSGLKVRPGVLLGSRASSLSPVVVPAWSSCRHQRFPARVLSCASGIFFQADLCCSPRSCDQFLSCCFMRFPTSLPFSCQFSLSALALVAGTSLALKPVDSSSCLPSSLPRGIAASGF